jgi:hypothetical protein
LISLDPTDCDSNPYLVHVILVLEYYYWLVSEILTIVNKVLSCTVLSTVQLVLLLYKNA